MRQRILTGIIVLIAAGVLAASGAGGTPSDKGGGISPRIEIENNTVVFLGFAEGSPYSIHLMNEAISFDQTYTGNMELSKGKPRYSVAFVTADSSNPNPENEVPEAGTYFADIWAQDLADNQEYTLSEPLVVLESTEE